MRCDATTRYGPKPFLRFRAVGRRNYRQGNRAVRVRPTSREGLGHCVDDARRHGESHSRHQPHHALGSSAVRQQRRPRRDRHGSGTVRQIHHGTACTA
ncbi:hypothetical protein SCOCK_140010 [Actinacidiphila cocklensis]|uniref:Uncharacterized protein n=1 Tax=Actinacidiphila cocklensis TaxID=887465 RepID=A0A9W4GP16_9ACTN|nr:hypothetical protein SCOCK_140010 [Actinacidiphila cocklensis]